MDRTGDQFFAGSALSVDQNGGFAGGDLPDQFEDLHHVTALSNHGGRTRVLTQ